MSLKVCHFLAVLLNKQNTWKYLVSQILRQDEKQTKSYIQKLNIQRTLNSYYAHCIKFNYNFANLTTNELVYCKSSLFRVLVAVHTYVNT